MAASDDVLAKDGGGSSNRADAANTAGSGKAEPDKDKETDRRWLAIFIDRRWSLLSAACFLLAIVGVCLLCCAVFNESTYMSENALLPGLVRSDMDHMFDGLVKTYSERLARADSDTEVNKAGWLIGALESLGADAYLQNYTARLPPLASAGVRRASGTNVYGIVRARRAAPLESIVIAVPWRRGAVNTPSAAVALTLAHAARLGVYWSKDVVFVFADGVLGMDAWLCAYHDNCVPALRHTGLETRAGAIQAALCLSTADTAASQWHINAAHVHYAMVNGKLPNLDLVNLVIRMLSREAIVPIVNGQMPMSDDYSRDGFVSSLRGTARALVNQAFALPHSLPRRQSDDTRMHTVFGRYGIEAVGVEPVWMDVHGGSRGQRMRHSFDGDGAHTWIDVARALESCTRSLNNLLERLHQSFFFYYLPVPRRYVSIGMYMPVVGLLLAALLLKAYAFWIRSGEQQIKQEKDMFAGIKSAQAHAHPSTDFSLLPQAAYWLGAAMPGVLLYLLPSLGGGTLSSLAPTALAQQAAWPVHCGLAVVLTAMPPVLLTQLPWAERRASPEHNGKRTCSRLRLSLLLLAVAAALGLLATLNYGLFALSAVFLLPVALLTQPRHTWFGRVLQQLLVCCIHPLVIVLVCAACRHGVDSAVECLVQLYVHSVLYQCALFPLLCIVALPLWTLLFVSAGDKA